MPGTVHVYPANDLIAHDVSTEEADCVCGPKLRPVERDDGSIAWLIVHNSLDGREQREGATAMPEEQHDRAPDPSPRPRPDIRPWNW
ncbi:hypothetical protein [Streptomyces sp.]|uniref:hypothetical protein n=1 Tax=Streptomyces sp. TaxID=1931 RepID=UPI002F3F0D56